MPDTCITQTPALTQAQALDAWPTATLLDALPDASAVLNSEGTIVAVNRAWRMFALDNGGSPAATGVGVSYLTVCDRAAAAGCSDAAYVVAGLQSVLNGETVESDLEYRCPSTTVGRWFMLRITLIAGREPGLLVSHVNISRQKMATQMLEQQASEDPLTRLANRTTFMQRLTLALTPWPGRALCADVGLVYLDLNRFKQVNDTFGHAAGDEVLQAVADRMSRQVRSQDTIARLGGDEFVVVAPQITVAGLTGLAARIDTVLAEPHLIHGQFVHVGASVGTYLATAGESAFDCVQQADQAMYAVKRGKY